MIRIWESGNESNSISVPVLKNTAQNKASVIKVKDCDYGTKINSAAEYIYYVEKFTKKTEATEADKSNVKWAFWLNETQEKLSEKHFVIEATADKQDADTDFLLTSTNEDETLKKQENYNSIKDNGILSAVIEIADVEIGTETKQMPVLKVKFSKWLDGELIKVEAFSDEKKLTLSSNNDFVASREVKAATPQISEVYWTTKDGERIETTGYSEEIYMNVVSLGLKGQTIEAHILERDNNNPDNLSEEGDQIEWENNQFVIESRTFTRQFKVISKEQGQTARQEDVDNGDTLFKMSFLQGLEDVEALELYLEVFNAADLGLDTTATYGELSLSIENNIVDAYFAKVTTEDMSLDAPLTDVLNSKKKKVGEKNTKGDVEQHEKLTRGVIGQKIKLVAECDNLDNDTEVIFQLFEKTPLLTAADTALKVVQEGKEVEEVIAKVKDGYAVTEVELSKYDSSTYKDWDSKLDTDKEGKESPVFLKVKEKESSLSNDFLTEGEFKLIPAITLYEIYHNNRIERTIRANAKKGKYYYIDSSNTKHLIFKTEYKKITSKYTSAFYGGKEVNLVDLRKYKSYDENGIKFKFDMKQNDNRPWIYQDTFASLLGAFISVGYEDLFCTGFSKADGSPGKSTSHKNGFNGDFRYLSEDGVSSRLRLDYDKEKDGIKGYDKLDVKRQENLIDAFYNYGWKSSLSQYYGKDGKSKLKRTTHDKNKAHYDHLHLQGYDRKFIKDK